MALQVNWNWRAPQVQQSNAAQNEANNLLKGAQSFADSWNRGKDRDLKREEDEQQQQRWLAEQSFAQDKFEHQKNQDRLANAMKNREFWETSRMNDLKEKQVLAELEQKKKQQEYMQQMYDKFFSDADEQELQQLLAKYQNGGGNASAVMAGLNPQFLNMR